jgi:DNA topoisomerase-1
VPKTLVIVESPAKARTITKFLGKNYTVKASMGHVRDLPRSQFGIDVENDYTPKYITIRGKGKILEELRKAAKKADTIYLATDPDREGEAISWHLAHALNIDCTKPCRIEFNEITKSAVKNALKSSRPIDQDLVDAQQARRALDRLVGYQLSPLLWNKVRRGLSAGRVQSAALKIICDREKEITAFVPEEYWSITAQLTPEKAQDTFGAKLLQKGKKKIHIPDEASAQEILDQINQQDWIVGDIRKKEKRRYPAPPFTTSSLQQAASRRLNFTAAKTMRIAQQLYEGLDVGGGTTGLITYIRTDSVNVAAEAQQQARQMIQDRYGAPMLPPKPPHYKSKAGSQGAHEAIRPTDVNLDPAKAKAYLTRDQFRLYQLIWERFVASQMAPAILDTVSVDIEIAGYLFRATGSTIKFPGFMSVYIEQEDEEQPEEGKIPPLVKGQQLKLVKLEPKQHFTQPPPRYSEALLVKTMEDLGIGRPSTYAPTIETIQKRGYVVLEDRRFRPTELGQIVIDLLQEHFPNVVDIDFTAQLEAQLDDIEGGKAQWKEVVNRFYQPFAQQLEEAKEEIERVTVADEVTDEVCELCGRNMVIKHGRFGKFLACPGFPECKNTKPILKEIGVKCPQCGGEIVERRSKRGRLFYGCSNYPQCELTSWQQPTGEVCPQCGSLMVIKRNKRGEVIQCSNKECKYQKK